MTEYEPPESIEAAALDIHRWLFEPQRGAPPRAELIDSGISVWQGSKFGTRILVWFGGFVLALAAGWNTIVATLAKFGGSS